MQNHHWGQWQADTQAEPENVHVLLTMYNTDLQPNLVLDCDPGLTSTASKLLVCYRSGLRNLDAEVNDQR